MLRMGMGIISVAVIACFTSVVNAQTTCSLRVPVADVSACDDVGALEENVAGGVWEVRGSVASQQATQDDAFSILSQQMTHINSLATTADADLLDIAGEIRTLKTFLANMAAVQADEAAGPGELTREKRAALHPSTQQLLTAAKTAFQQAIVDVGGKLQNLTRTLQDHVTQTSSLHAAIQARLNTNIRDITSTDAQVSALEQDIQRARAALPSGGGVSLTNVSQEVVRLMVGSQTAAAVTQRQLDGMDKQIQHLEGQEVAIGHGIRDTANIIQGQDPRLNAVSTSVNRLRSATRIYEDRIGDFITNATRDMTAAQTQLNTTQSLITKLRSDYFNLTLTQTALGTDITSIRPSIDGVQTLVTYNGGISGSQSGDILRLKKSLSDDVAVLKYVFGLTSTMP